MRDLKKSEKAVNDALTALLYRTKTPDQSVVVHRVLLGSLVAYAITAGNVAASLGLPFDDAMMRVRCNQDPMQLVVDIIEGEIIQ